MSILTPFFNLIKPAKTDRYKVSDFNANFDTIDTEMHRPPLTVNGNQPDPVTRDIHLETVPLADNLSSDEAIFNQGTYLVRTSGGGAPISDGVASLSTIKGNMVKTGYIPEEINMTVNAVPRVAPPQITAVLDAETFEAYVETAGTYTLSYTSAWSANPALYGVTVTNTPVSGDQIVIVWDGENEPEMTVNAVERPVPAPITATLDRDTFVSYVTQSGTVTLSYTSGWSANPALYGITVQNTPVSGDSIVVIYVKENRGTITPAMITAFNATGWNLFQASEGYAMVVRYSDDYGYKIGGSYSLVNFATTPTGTSTAVDVDADGYFNVPSDGYVLVVGGDATTYIYPTWSDWVEGYEGDFESYTVDTVDLSEIMVSFPAGLLAINEIRDEINFNTQRATSNIQRLEYTPENLESVIASGVLYDTDTSYIYAVRETPVVVSFDLDGTYTVSDHGLEFFTATTTTPPVTETIYGDNLKDKLRSDVLTISAQELSAAQQAQVFNNIGLRFFRVGQSMYNKTLSDLVTDIGAYNTGIIIYFVGYAIVRSLSGSSSTAGTGCVIIAKVSSSAANYFVSNNDTTASGSINLTSGVVTVGTTSEVVGVTNTSSTIPDKTIPSGADTDVGYFDVPAGDYVIIITANFASNATGYRSVWISETAGGTQLNLASRAIASPVSGVNTRFQLPITYSTSTAKRLYVVAYQNSGSSLAMNTRYAIARLK